jgi:hypothetical protein
VVLRYLCKYYFAILIFLINIQRPVLGFNTLPSGHFLGDLVIDFLTALATSPKPSFDEVSLLASLRTYITPTEKKNETRLFIFIYLKTMF